MKKNFISMLSFIFLLGLVCSLILAGIHGLTKKRIERNKTLFIKRAVLECFKKRVLGQNIDKIYEAEIKEIVFTEKLKLFQSIKDKNYGIYFSGTGLWGPVTGVITVDKELKRIIAVKIIHQEETPGVGGRIAEKEYLNEYRGKGFLPKIALSMNPVKNNEVHAISGATMTSRAFEDILNKSLKKLKERVSQLQQSN